MKKYILSRLIKSIFAILVVVAIVVVILYRLVPTYKVFESDDTYRKLKGNNKTQYTYKKLEELGYLDYMTMSEMAKKYANGNTQALDPKSDAAKEGLSFAKSDGYTVQLLDKNDELRGQYIAYKYYNVVQLIGKFFSRMVVIDSPGKIQDENNPDLKRGYSIAKDMNAVPALVCSGCKYKYQIYFNSSFPFIHQNFFKLYFGESYPTFSGLNTLDVIGGGQGTMKKFEQTFPTGQKSKSAILQHSASYKYELDHLDKKRFDDHYADTKNKYESPSMIGTSFIFGVFSIIFAYAFALPAGISMARNKGKWQDRLGIVYINLLIAVPSLAFIFFMRYLGSFLGMPDKFPLLGFKSIKSFIMPIIILGLMSTPSLMMWIRRYMVDQQNADYVKFAKAKGLSQKEISKNHILKNAIIPIVNGIPMSIILAISGAVITESLFAIPGMGKMLPDAIKTANNNMVITITFIFTTLSVLSVFVGDLLMTFVDPRISLNVKEDE